MTHFVYSSQLAGIRSLTPLAAFRRFRSSTETCGAIRSTILLGNAPFSSIQSATSAEIARAKETTARRVVSPLLRRLSQETTVKGLSPFARRVLRAATIKPKAVIGVGLE